MIGVTERSIWNLLSPSGRFWGTCAGRKTRDLRQKSTEDKEVFQKQGGDSKPSKVSAEIWPVLSTGDLLMVHRWSVLGACALIGILVFAAFWPIQNNSFLSFDDDTYITGNRWVQQGLTVESIGWAFSSWRGANWHPVTWISHMLDVELFGLDPVGHHWASVVIHVLNCLLIYFFLARITGERWASAALILLFAVHPLRVESVAWAAERKDVLCMFFWMISLLAYLAYIRVGRRRFYAASILAFALALMSKPMALTLPVILLLIDVWVLQRVPSLQGLFTNSRLWLEKLPFLGLSMASSVVTLLAQSEAGAVVAVESLSLLPRLVNALSSYLTYLAKTLWPARLAVLYPLSDDSAVWWKAGLALILLGLVSVLVTRSVKRLPLLTSGWFWFLVTLVPVLGILQVGNQSWADRYSYIPSVGLLMMGTVMLAAAARNYLPGPGWVVPAGFLLAFPLVLATRQQLSHWRDSESLFRRTLAVTRDNPVMHLSLGVELSRQNRREEAVAQYEEALRLRPTYVEAMNNLGAAKIAQGRIDEGIELYGRALKLRPDYVDALNNLAMTYAAKGQHQTALGVFQRALQLQPDAAQVHYNMGVAYFQLGNVLEAREKFRQAIFHDPLYVKAYYNQGVLRLTQGEFEAAAAALVKGISIQDFYPEAHYNLALAYWNLGHQAQALAELRKALEQQPDYSRARETLKTYEEASRRE